MNWNEPTDLATDPRPNGPPGASWADLGRALLEATPGSTAIIDRQGNILYVNRRWCEFARRGGANDSPSFWTERNYLIDCRAVTGPDSPLAEQACAGIRGVLAGGPDFAFPYPCDLPGERCWFLLRAAPLAGCGLVVVHHVDITDVKRREEALTLEKAQLETAQAALRASEERYRSLAEAAEDFIYIIGADDRVRYVNSFGARHLNASPEELVGRLRAELFPPDISKRQRSHVEQVLSTGRPIRVQDVAEFQGRRFWQDTRLVPLFDQHGRPDAVLGLSRDVTGHVEAEEQREELLRRERAARDEADAHRARLQALLERLREAVIIVDADGRTVLANQSAREIGGCTDAESPSVLASRVTWLRPDGTPMAPEDRPTVRVLRGETVSGEEGILVRPDGSRCTLQVTGTSVPGDVSTDRLSLLVCRDVTELRRLQQLREDYLSLVTHDLRGPLSVLVGQGELLEKLLLLEGGPPRTSWLMTSIRRNVDRLTAMVKDLADVSQLESGTLRLEKRPLDLGRFIAELVERGWVPEERARIQLEVAGPLPELFCDPDRIERLVYNLVSNALKYSAPGSPILVKVSADQACAAISVVDHGVGIHREDFPHLFERYYRSRHAAGGQGVGLGLYIARLITDAHGGTISVASEPGRGSCFSVQLPLATP